MKTHTSDWKFEFFAVHDMETGQAVSHWNNDLKECEWDGDINDAAFLHYFKESARFSTLTEAEKVRDILTEEFLKEFPEEEVDFQVFRIKTREVRSIEMEAEEIRWSDE